MMRVFVCGLSMPLSMMVVATRTSILRSAKSSITSSTAFGGICPCATPTLASGAASRTRAVASSMSATRFET